MRDVKLRIDKLYKALIDLKSNPLAQFAKIAKGKEGKKRARRLAFKKMKNLSKLLKDVESEYHKTIEEIKLKSPGYARIKYPQPVKIDYVQKNLLDKDTAMFVYYIFYKREFRSKRGKQKFGGNAYLVLVKKDEAKVVELIDSEKLNQKVKWFLMLTKQSYRDSLFKNFLKSSNELYNELIKPIKKRTYKTY